MLRSRSLGSGIAEAYTNGTEERSAVGIYLMTWFMVTFFLYLFPLLLL